MTENSAVKKIPNKKYGNQTLSECIKKLHLNSKTADVHFTIESEDGSTERVPAHKSLLASVSNVLEAMFYGDLKEDGDVLLTDATAAGVQEFLQFFYLEQVELTEENVVEVMHLGHKYNVIRCEDACIQFLKDTLTDDNIFIAMNIAILYDHRELMKFCEKHLIANSDAVLKSPNFLECDKKILAHILKMNLLSCSETIVFESCMLWVKTKSKQDLLTKEIVLEYLGDSFYDIRFSSMAVGDFIALSLKHDYAFSTDQYKDIIQTFTPSGGHLKLFNGNPRQVQWNEDAVIICNREEANKDIGQLRIPNTMTTKFSSNEPILLGGFTCAKVSVSRDGQYHDLRSDLPIDVTVTEFSDQNNTITLSNQRASLPSKLETVILLPKPVLVRPGHFYEIHLSQSPEGHHLYANELKTKVQLMESDVTIEFHSDHTTTSKGIIVNLVTALLFNNI